MGIAVVEEVEDVVTQFVVVGVFHDNIADSGPGEGDGDNFADSSLWPISHHDYPVSQEESLINIMGEH